MNVSVVYSNHGLAHKSSSNSTIGENSEMIHQSINLKTSTVSFATALDQLVKDLKTLSTTILPNKPVKTSTHYIDSTTPSVKDSVTTPKMTMYQMAVHLLPHIIAADPEDDKDISRFLLNYSETKNWPKWKRRVLTKKIIKLLDEQEDETFQATSAQLPAPQVTVVVPTSSTNGTKSKSHQSYKDLQSLVVQGLMPVYQKRKSTNPSMTVIQFLNTLPETRILSKTEKEVLANFINEILHKSEALSKRKRSLKDDQSDTTGTPAQIDKVGSTAPGSVEIEMTSVAFMEILLPRITDNISTFLIVCFIVIAGEMFAAPVEILSDSSFHELLDELDSSNRYGRHKVFAVVAAMVSALAVSTVIYFSPCFVSGSISRFNIHFYAYATLLCAAFLVIPFYPTYARKASHQPRTNPVSLCPTCRIQMCSECRNILLFFTVLIVGAMQAALQDFLLWQVYDLPQSSELVYGAYISANALATLLAIPIGRRLTSVLQSSVTVPISLCAVASQMLLCSLIRNAWLVVPLQVLTVFGAPFLWVIINSELKMMMLGQDDLASLRALDQVHVFAKSSQKRALLVAYLCTYQGLASSIGSFVSGFAYDASGGSLIPFLRVGSGVVGGWACFYALIHCCCIRKRKMRSYSQLLEDSEDELETFNIKTHESEPDSKKPKSNYAESGRKVAESRRKRRNRKLASSSSEDDLEREWSAMSTRKESRRM